jgi:hypothetical protein
VVRFPAGAPVPARRAGGWPAGWVVPAGSMVSRPVVPRSADPHTFRTPAQVPIGPYGFAQGKVTAGGACQLQVGPAGFYTSWMLAQASIGTTTGANDLATAQFFAQPYGAPSPAQQIGQSYAAGGDQVGLSGIKLVTGEFLIVVWSGAKPGDTCTLVLSGVQTVMT